LFDLGLDLVIPPLSRIAVLSLAGLAVSAGATLLSPPPALALCLFGFSTGSVVLYVLRGWSVSGTGLRGLRDLGLAPVYVAWKATLGRRARPGSDWVRTKREGQA